jgi:hypothetical protein
MSRLYREARAGKIASGEATRLAYILREIRMTIEAERVEALEAKVNDLLARSSDAEKYLPWIRRHATGIDIMDPEP